MSVQPSNIDKEDEEFLNVIIRNAKRLRCLSENILDVSKIESQTLKLNKEKFNINEEIRNVINDTKSKEGSRIEITFAEPKVDPIVVEADKMRIYEVISNLFSNAIKFTKKSSSSNRTDASIDNDNNGGSNITVFTTIKS
jgi:signal transduction histidine kinase